MAIDNKPSAVAAKVDLRRRVVVSMGAAHVRVFEAFCGLEVMRGLAWHDVGEWVGCDKAPWDIRRDSPRFVGDNCRVLRCIDLAHFNVFDFDAYGSPWEQMHILAVRRRWAPGERGAVVLTDGTALALRLGGRIQSMSQDCMATGATRSDETQRATLAEWVRRSGVTVERLWEARGHGQSTVRYSAVSFTGNSSPVGVESR